MSTQSPDGIGASGSTAQRGPPRHSSSSAAPVDEGEAARRSREYHDRTHRTLDLETRRPQLAAFAARFYKERLRVLPTPGELGAFNALADPETLAIEVAHDGQLPHLGIVRLVLKADEIAQRDGNAVTLYLIGNHYSPDMRPDNIHFGMPLRGCPPNRVKSPPKLRIGGPNLHTPFRWLPSPSAAELSSLRSQIDQFLKHNVAHERGRGSRITPDVDSKTKSRLGGLFDVLGTAAREVGNLGDWMIRVQHDLFQRMLGQGADRILFLPMADLIDLFRGDLVRVARAATEGGMGGTRFWVYCPSCLRRQRVAWTPGMPTNFGCNSCGHQATFPESELWRWLMPDVVAYEVGVFRVGIAGWVIGSNAPYHSDIEKLYPKVFGIEMPPKFPLTSAPWFRGLGDAPEGYGKTRLLRAWLEADPAAIAAALRAPWNENPRLSSDVMSPSDDSNHVPHNR